MTSAAVVGLGRIGAANDYAGGDVPRSHLGALLQTGFSISGLSDVSPEACAAAIRRWPELAGVPCAETLSGLGRVNADVVVLAAPSQGRMVQVRAALMLDPKILIVEKPVAENLAEATDIARAIARSGSTARVNFHRRVDAAHVAAKKEIRADGAPVKVVMSYGKGLYNYASHLVDFLIDWFGPIAAVEAFGSPAAQNPSFCCHMQAGFEAVVIGMDGLEFDDFEINISTPRRRLSLHSGGVERYGRTAAPDRFYPGYTQLGAPELLAPAAPVAGLVELYVAAKDHITRGSPLPGCTMTDAVHGMAVLDAVTQSFRSGRAVPLETIAI